MNSISGPYYVLSEICSHTMFRSFDYDSHLHDPNKRGQWICKGINESTFTFSACMFSMLFLSLHCTLLVHIYFSQHWITKRPWLLCTKYKFLGLVLLRQGLEGMEGTPWVLWSKKSMIQKLLGQVDVTYMCSQINTHFCIEILFKVFSYSEVSCLVQYTSFHFSSKFILYFKVLWGFCAMPR